MLITSILAVLFIIVGVSNAFAGDMLGVYGCFTVAAVLIGLLIFINNEKKKMKNFMNWLVTNRVYIERDIADYNGTSINMSTQFSSYVFCVSAVFFTQMIPTRLVIRGTFEAAIMKIVNILFTILFGLWAFPRGPIYVVTLTIKNLSGGNKLTARQLLEQIDEEGYEVDFTKTEEYQKTKEQRYNNEINY